MDMRFDKFTLKLQEAIQDGQDIASKLQHAELSPGHVFLATLAQEEGVVKPVLVQPIDQGLRYMFLPDELFEGLWTPFTRQYLVTHLWGLNEVHFVHYSK